jgi:LAO/AO transport system kinase
MRDADDQIPTAIKVLKELYPQTGKAYVIGITGVPGSGKSTIVDKMAEIFRKEGKTVGILAVDPTSPFTGGAILGDRIRMQRHTTDEGVFVGRWLLADVETFHVLLRTSSVSWMQWGKK